MKSIPAVTKALVESIMRNGNVKWQLQGFGMLRTYLSNDVRLQIWDHRYAYEDVSLIHDHPWDFESLVVAGVQRNQRYDVRPRYANEHPLSRHFMPYMQRTIKPGVGLKLLSEDAQVWLVEHHEEQYDAGMSYRQLWNEVHASRPMPGTVTIITRTRRGRPDTARVFYEAGKQWGTAEPRDASPAEPRDASPAEAADIIERSLSLWFQEQPSAT